MKLVSCHFPEGLLEGLDELVDLKIFPNRSEAIRVFVRDGIIKEMGFIQSKRK